MCVVLNLGKWWWKALIPGLNHLHILVGTFWRPNKVSTWIHRPSHTFSICVKKTVRTPLQEDGSLEMPSANFHISLISFLANMRSQLNFNFFLPTEKHNLWALFMFSLEASSSSFLYCFSAPLFQGYSEAWHFHHMKLLWIEEKWVVLEISHATLHKSANDQMFAALNKELKEVSQTTQFNSFVL